MRCLLAAKGLQTCFQKAFMLNGTGSLRARSFSTAYVFVALSGIISGIIVFSGKLLADFGLSLFEVSTLPFVFTVIFLAPFVVLQKRYRSAKGSTRALLLYGFVSAVIGALQFAGVFLGVPVVIVVLLLYTQPLWTVAMSAVFLREKMTGLDILAVAFVLVGVFILVNPLTVSSIGSPLGIAFSLLGGVSLAGWLSVGSYLSKKGNDPVNSLFFGAVVMLVILACAFPLLSLFVHDPAITEFTLRWPLRLWLLLIGFNLVTQVCNHLLYLYGVKRVPTVRAGVLMLLEPVSAAVLASLFLRQPVTVNIVLGGSCILFANYLVMREAASSRHVAQE